MTVPETQRRDDQPVLRLALAQNREAPSLARAAIAGFSEYLEMDPATFASLTLLVSEVVTNAVIHPSLEPPGDIQLSARIAGGVIHVEVTDQGSGFKPKPRDPAQSDRGYGLYLLEQQAADWGVEQQAADWGVEQQAADWGVEQQTGNTVWFELAVY